MPNKENEKYLLYGNINGLIDFERNSSNIFRGENDEHLDKLLLWAPINSLGKLRLDSCVQQII